MSRIMQKLTVFVVALAAFCLHCEAKHFTRCGLVQELRRQGFPEDKMRDWVCLVENESGRKTDKMGTVNKNGSRDYGLFQINDKYWCSNTSTPGKDCNVTCARIMQKLAVFFVALAAFCLHCEAKHFTRCGLVQELRRQGFPEDKMRDWVCLVENESGRKTDKMGTVNKNGSRDYGLFQINDKYWCSNTSTPGKDCNKCCWTTSPSRLNALRRSTNDTSSMPGMDGRTTARARPCLTSATAETLHFKQTKDLVHLTVFVVALAAFCLHCEAKHFTRCGLVQELRRQGFPEDKMRDWVCLVENESGRKTDKMGTVNKNGSRDYGLFQINDKYWCSNTSTPGKDCNVTCALIIIL
ncbi:hypothetical protein HW555_001418 [Spodoptera exigua]|uniref:lysozyme n=1 Tax=Spodoptera exigua TaxID=7107 RepID=A0A835GQ30_SPOEX|nr:hypothetical protein HW555_001418 [Spodoptera exigua]